MEAQDENKIKKRRKDLRKSQETHGVLQTIHGGFTYRLGNEVENFSERFGLAKAVSKAIKKSLGYKAFFS